MAGGLVDPRAIHTRPLPEPIMGLPAGFERLSILPFAVNQATQETMFARPQLLQDLITGFMAPADIATGRRTDPAQAAVDTAMAVAGSSGLAGPLGAAPGALGMGAVRAAPTAAPQGLLDVLGLRAAQMELPVAARVQPRQAASADVTPAIATDEGAYLRHPLQFDENVGQLQPRRAGGPYPLNDRVRPLIDRQEEIARKLAERAQSQMGTNTQYFYHTGPVYEAAIEAGLSPEQARKWMRDFGNAYAATSPRTETARNLRNASLVMAKEEAGIPVREVIGAGTGGISEKGYPMMVGPSGVHGQLVDAIQSGAGIPFATNPKPATFARNVEGNLSGVTADTHAIRGALDALNEIEPGSIPKEWIKKEFREAYEKNPEDLNPATWIDDTLKSAAIKGEKAQVEYGPVADVYARMAEIMGVSPAEAQSMGWFGSGSRTGLASESKTIAELLNERIDVTAQLLGQDPKTVARRFFNREIPLATTPMSAGLLPAIVQGGTERERNAE